MLFFWYNNYLKRVYRSNGFAGLRYFTPKIS